MPKERKMKKKNDAQPGAVESCFLDPKKLQDSLSDLFMFGVAFYDNFAAFEAKFFSEEGPIPDSPREREEMCGQSGLVDVNLGTNALACVWSINAKPSWIFMDMGGKARKRVEEGYVGGNKFVVLRAGEDIGSISVVLRRLGGEVQQAKSEEIESSLLQELKRKISGCKEKEEVVLSLKEFNLATYTVIRQLVDEIVDSYEFVVDGIQKEPLKLSDEECSNLATYIAGLAPQNIIDFEKFLISVMKLPEVSSPLKKGRSFFNLLFEGRATGSAPTSPITRISRQGSRQSFNLPRPKQDQPKPDHSRSRSSGQSCSVPSSPCGQLFTAPCSRPGSRPKTPLQVSHEEKLTKKEGASSPSPIKSGQGSCPPSPSRTKSRGIAVDSPSIWQRLKQRSKRIYEKWKALSLGYKIMAVMAFAIGVSAIVYGCVFCSPVVVLIPLVGSLSASAIAVIGGTILAGIASVAHAFHVSFTKANSSNVGGEENYAVSSYLKRGGTPPVDSSLDASGSSSVSSSSSKGTEAVGALTVSPPPAGFGSPPMARIYPIGGGTNTSYEVYLNRRGSPALFTGAADRSSIDCSSVPGSSPTDRAFIGYA